jgi:hypothetical protein
MLAVTIMSLAVPHAQTVPDKTEDAAKLAQILQKTADYCRKLENAVLDFVCLEEVKETFHTELFEREFNTGFYRVVNRPVDNTFLYEYQLIRNAEKTEESRTLIERNGKGTHEKAAGVGTLRFLFEKVIYGPVDLLKLSHQPYFDYTLIKEEPKPGDREVIIQALPKTSEQGYRPFGKIWVRESDFAIVKIDYDRRSIRDLYDESREARQKKGETRLELTSEFGVERNGIRFPSRLVFQESDVHKSGQASVRTRAVIMYKDYRFFSVIVDVDYE